MPLRVKEPRSSSITRLAKSSFAPKVRAKIDEALNTWGDNFA